MKCRTPDNHSNKLRWSQNHSWECLHFLYAYLSLRLIMELKITISKISQANHFEYKTPANQSNKWSWSENHSCGCNAFLSLRLTEELTIVISKILQATHFKYKTPANPSNKLRCSKNHSVYTFFMLTCHSD